MQEGIAKRIQQLHFTPKQDKKATSNVTSTQESSPSETSQVHSENPSISENIQDRIEKPSQSENSQELVINRFICSNPITDEVESPSDLSLDEPFICQAMNSAEPTPFRGFARFDDQPPEQWNQPKAGALNDEFVRTTNTTGVYQQRFGTCYVHAAVSAYINTISRIKNPRRPIPPVSECYKVAYYQGDTGGDPAISIQRMEQKFQFGIKWEKTKELPSIRDACIISIILSFTTSEEGYQAIGRGSLTKRPNGNAEGWHAVLIEG